MKGEWPSVSRMTMTGFTSPAFAFFSVLTNKVILCVQTSEVSLVRSEKIFFLEGPSLCSASLLSP